MLFQLQLSRVAWLPTRICSCRFDLWFAPTLSAFDGNDSMIWFKSWELMDWVMCVSAREYETMRGSWDLDVSRIQTALLMSNPPNKNLRYRNWWERNISELHESFRAKAWRGKKWNLYFSPLLTVGCSLPPSYKLRICMHLHRCCKSTGWWDLAQKWITLLLFCGCCLYPL